MRAQPLSPRGHITADEQSGEGQDDNDISYSRWLTSSWVIYNNKGNPVQNYQPCFSGRYSFQDRAIHGVSPILLYDVLSRTVAVINADHTWSKKLSPHGIPRAGIRLTQYYYLTVQFNLLINAFGYEEEPNFKEITRSFTSATSIKTSNHPHTY
jgi:hypothetical protein